MCSAGFAKPACKPCTTSPWLPRGCSVPVLGIRSLQSKNEPQSHPGLAGFPHAIEMHVTQTWHFLGLKQGPSSRLHNLADENLSEEMKKMCWCSQQGWCSAFLLSPGVSGTHQGSLWHAQVCSLYVCEMELFYPPHTLSQCKTLNICGGICTTAV